MHTDYETLLIEQRGGVCCITLNRPERLNAWTYRMGGELNQALQQANADPQVDAIVVTGAGRGFCAGADIEAVFKAQAEGEDVTQGGGAGDWVNLVRESKPIVAAINGAAIGVGFTQVLPMDYLIAAEGAKLSLRFVKMGLIPELASSHFLAARVGFGHASELMLSGRTLPAEEGLAIGLVDRVVAPETLLDSAVQVAQSMGENPHGALRHIKQLLTVNTHETDLNLVQRRELEALHESYQSAEHAEAIRAFMEKRAPDFKAARAADT